MKILGLEFSSGERSAAVGTAASWQSGKIEILSQATQSCGTVTHVFSLVERALMEASTAREEIEVIVVGRGPGSYTGVRMAVAVAQGWQLGRGIKLAGVSSAEAIAASAWGRGWEGWLGVAIDAQRGEFYLEEFELDEAQYRSVSPLRLASREQIESMAGKGQIAGPEMARGLAGAADLYPEADQIIKIGCARADFIAGELLEPIYLRETQFVKAPPGRTWG